MKNLILFTGANKYRIDKLIEDKIKETRVDELSLVRYDTEETLIEDIVADCETLPFLTEHKVVIVSNLIFLSSEKSKLEHNYDKFFNYLNNPNPSTILILNAYQVNLDKKRKINKLLLEKCDIYNNDNLNEQDARELITKRMKALNVKMDYDAINELIIRTGCDEEKINIELEKIAFYIDSQKEITIQDIKLLVSEPIENNVFDLTNSILDRNVPKAIQLYHKLLQQNEEPIMFSAILGKNFHHVYVIKQYQKQNYTEAQIRTLLKIHPFQLKKLYQLALGIKEKEIVETINALSLYDIQVKSGRMDKYLGFELLILQR